MNSLKSVKSLSKQDQNVSNWSCASTPGVRDLGIGVTALSGAVHNMRQKMIKRGMMRKNEGGSVFGRVFVKGRPHLTDPRVAGCCHCRPEPGSVFLKHAHSAHQHHHHHLHHHPPHHQHHGRQCKKGAQGWGEGWMAASPGMPPLFEGLGGQIMLKHSIIIINASMLLSWLTFFVITSYFYISQDWELKMLQ